MFSDGLRGWRSNLDRHLRGGWDKGAKKSFKSTRPTPA